MNHIIHKHDSYCIVRPNAVGVKHFVVFTNGDVPKGFYPIENEVIPEIPGYEETELQVLYENFRHAKGRA